MVVLGLLACLIFGFGLLSRRVEGTVVSAPIHRGGGGSTPRHLRGDALPLRP